METDPILGLLGLARRGNRLACGAENVAAMVTEGRARAIFLANDCGGAALRSLLRFDERVPVLTLGCGREELGRAVGVPGCIAVAVSDMGMAASAAQKLAPLCKANEKAAARVLEKKAYIDSRKGWKKPKK